MSATTHPVDAIAAARAGGFGLPLQRLPEAGDPGWRPAGAAAADAALREELLRSSADATGTGSPMVAATWLLEKHAWHVAAVALGSVLLDGRVPPLERLLVRDGAEGWVEALALPGDGWRPGGAKELAAGFEAHLAPLVEELAAHRARRPLWRSAGDRLGQAALWCGEAFGDSARAVRLAADVLTAPTALRAPARFTVHEGVPFRRRTGCCLSYRCPGEVSCEDCSRVRAAP